jgi:hypothetical protein
MDHDLNVKMGAACDLRMNLNYRFVFGARVGDVFLRWTYSHNFVILPKEIFPMDHNRKLSRRSVLRGAALLASAALTASMVPSKEADAQQKASQQAMQYQDKPNGDKRCSNCLSFIAPSSCAIVEGTVSSNGYCLAWAKKN